MQRKSGVQFITNVTEIQNNQKTTNDVLQIAQGLLHPNLRDTCACLRLDYFIPDSCN